MKLSCLPVSFFEDIIVGHRALVDWFAFAGQLGLDGTDVSIALLKSRHPEYLDLLRSQAASAGVRIVMMSTYSDLTHPDPTERARQIRDLGANIEALGNC